MKSSTVAAVCVFAVIILMSALDAWSRYWWSAEGYISPKGCQSEACYLKGTIKNGFNGFEVHSPDGTVHYIRKDDINHMAHELDLK